MSSNRGKRGPNRGPHEPWLHEASGIWCKKIDRELIYLDPDYRVAKRKLAEIWSERKREAACGGPDWIRVLFVDLADEYLTDLKARRASETYDSARYRLARAFRILGTKIKVGELRKFHLAKIEQALVKGSPTTAANTIAAVQRVISWAVSNELLDQNLLQGYKKPAEQSRHRIVTPVELQRLFRASWANPPFRRVLITMWWIGCRPGEIRKLIWEWVDLEAGMWVMPRHKTSTMQRDPMPRMVPLPEPILKLCRWLARKPHLPSDHVFVNVHGTPYTKDRFVQNFDRARKRAGIEVKAGEQLVMYSHRHTWFTDNVGKVSDQEIAELGGNSTRMLKRYYHANPQRLHDIRRRIDQR